MKFIAFASNSTTSGPRNTREECEQWAKKVMNGSAVVTDVTIFRSVAKMEREILPIIVTELEEPLPPKDRHALYPLGGELTHFGGNSGFQDTGE